MAKLSSEVQTTTLPSHASSSERTHESLNLGVEELPSPRFFCPFREHC